jgi:hypothetical protein
VAQQIRGYISFFSFQPIIFAKQYGADFATKPARFVTGDTVRNDIEILTQTYLKEV